jgi:2'-5' RNA ligase
MAQWAIVAIPEEDDYVWKISSEKIPHMTLVFLGEQSDYDLATRITEFLSHLVEMNIPPRFGMTVDHRGVLGPDQADVLFFETEYAKTIVDARNYMLANNDIKNAYDSTDQYPEWTPHLTLGYPQAPAKEDKREYPGIHWVSFDKLALWTGDFSGVELELKRDESMAMSDPAGDFLQHYGVLGMKWGVRKASSGGGSGSSKTRPPKAPEAVQTRATATKRRAGGVSSLSNSELRSAIERMNLEKQYKQLNPSTADRGKKLVKDLLVSTGKEVAKEVIKSAAKKGVDVAMESAMSALSKK